MRMNSEQAELSVRVIRKYFADAAVWLFGSRVDDSRKGGDFDFYIETALPGIALPMARARGELTDSLGMKVDLAVNNHTGDKPIFSHRQNQRCEAGVIPHRELMQAS